MYIQGVLCGWWLGQGWVEEFGRSQRLRIAHRAGYLLWKKEPNKGIVNDALHAVQTHSLPTVLDKSSTDLALDLPSYK